MSFDAIGANASDTILKGSTLALQVFFTACESTISNRVHCGFFGRVLAPANATSSESDREHLRNASVCNARTLWSRAASLSANRPNYNRSSIDKTPHPKFGVSSKLAVLFSAFLAVRVQWFPILCRLSYWCRAFILILAHLKKIPNGFYSSVCHFECDHFDLHLQTHNWGKDGFLSSSELTWTTFSILVSSCFP